MEHQVYTGAWPPIVWAAPPLSPFLRELRLLSSSLRRVVTIGTTSILQLDHTPLATVDWTRGEHLTEGGPIRVSIPRDRDDWDRENDKAFSAGLDKLHVYSEMLAARFSA